VTTGTTGHDQHNTTDCTHRDAAELDCTADELTITGTGPGETGDAVTYRSTTPAGGRYAVIHAEATLGAATLAVLIAHLQHIHRALQ